VGAGGELAIIAGRAAGGVAVPGDAVFRQAPEATPGVAQTVGADQVGGSTLQCLGGGSVGGCGGGGDG